MQSNKSWASVVLGDFVSPLLIQHLLAAVNERKTTALEKLD